MLFSVQRMCKMHISPIVACVYCAQRQISSFTEKHRNVTHGLHVRESYNCLFLQQCFVCFVTFVCLQALQWKKYIARELLNRIYYLDYKDISVFFLVSSVLFSVSDSHLL